MIQIAIFSVSAYSTTDNPTAVVVAAALKPFAFATGCGDTAFVFCRATFNVKDGGAFSTIYGIATIGKGTAFVLLLIR